MYSNYMHRFLVNDHRIRWISIALGELLTKFGQLYLNNLNFWRTEIRWIIIECSKNKKQQIVSMTHLIIHSLLFFCYIVLQLLYVSSGVHLAAFITSCYCREKVSLKPIDLWRKQWKVSSLTILLMRIPPTGKNS